MVALVQGVYGWTPDGKATFYPAGTDHTDIPTATLTTLRGPHLWPGGDISHLPPIPGGGGGPTGPISIADVEGLADALDARVVGPITVTDVEGLTDALDEKVDGPVDIADVTGLQDALNSTAKIVGQGGLPTSGRLVAAPSGDDYEGQAGDFVVIVETPEQP